MTSTLCVEGGAYSADAAGTARVSQEHRCVPHRTAILLLEGGAVDGFILMTLHMSLCYDVEDKAEKASYAATNRSPPSPL